MTERIFYTKSPVTEALIDLRAAQPNDFVVTSFLKAFEEISEKFPNREEIIFGEGQVTLGQGSPEVEISQRHTGYRFISRDKRKVVQIRTDGFTFSQLAPYTRWEELRDEARYLWDVLRTKTEVSQVTRIAVRYINRLDIPEQSFELSDYLKTYPKDSPDYEPKNISNFFMQLQLPRPDIEGFLILNEALTMPPAQGISSIVLDLDLFSERPQEPWDTSDDGEIWNFLNTLNEAVYKVFEASITDKMRELIR